MNMLDCVHRILESLCPDRDLDLTFRFTAYRVFFSDIRIRSGHRPPRAHHMAAGKAGIVGSDMSCVSLAQHSLLASRYVSGINISSFKNDTSISLLFPVLFLSEFVFPQQRIACSLEVRLQRRDMILREELRDLIFSEEFQLI